MYKYIDVHTVKFYASVVQCTCNLHNLNFNLKVTVICSKRWYVKEVMLVSVLDYICRNLSIK